MTSDKLYESVAGHVARVAVCGGLLSMFLYRISLSVVDPDLWHEMALAREIIALRAVPWEDTFAYTPTVFPVVHHEWGAGMVALMLVSWVGAAGIVFAKFLLAVVPALVCWRCARRRGADLAVLSFLAPIAIFMADSGFSTIRAQMYSYLFCACLLYWLQRDREGGRRWLVAWFAVFPCWVNLHAGFLVGAGLFVVHCVEQLVKKQPHRHLLVAGVAMIPMVAINPYGVHYYRYLLQATTMARPMVDEWSPLWRSGNPVHVSLFIVALLMLVYSLRHVAWRQWHGLPIVLVTALASVSHQRMLPFFAVAWMCYLPNYLLATPLGREMEQLWGRRKAVLIGIWSFITVAMIVRAIPHQPWKLQVPGYRVAAVDHHIIYPVGAVDYLKDARFRGNVMVPFDHGSYVMWKLHPDVKISMDGRYEVAYPPHLADENYQFYMAKQGWRDVLTAYSTDVVLVPKSLPVCRAMEKINGWVQVYTDRQFVLYAKSALPLPRVDCSDRLFAGQFP